MSLVHYEYIWILVVAWAWGLSQVVHAATGEWVRPWPPSRSVQWMLWRITAATWMLVKAIFLSYVAYYTWDDMPGHEEMIGVLAFIHFAAFVQWVLLPSERRPVAEPPVLVTSKEA